MKRKLTPNRFCVGNAICLLDFVKQVFYMPFAETPNYDKLRFSLLSALLDEDQVPSKVMDWDEQQRASEIKKLVSIGSYD